MFELIAAIGCILLLKVLSVWYTYYVLMSSCKDNTLKGKAIFKVAVYKNFFQLYPIFEDFECSYLTYTTFQKGTSSKKMYSLLEEDIINLQMIQGFYVLQNSNPTISICVDGDKIIDIQMLLDELEFIKQYIDDQLFLKELFSDDHL
jgi:hypothetical protein